MEYYDPKRLERQKIMNKIKNDAVICFVFVLIFIFAISYI